MQRRKQTAILSNGFRAFAAAQSMGSQRLKDLPAPAADNDAARRKYVDDILAAGLAGLGTYKYCRAHNSADLTPGTSPLTFEANTDDADADAMHDTASNKDRFVAVVAGYYRVSARFKVQGFDGCAIQWFKNGAAAAEGDQPQFVEPQADGPVTFLTDSIVIQLAANDYVSVKVYGAVEPDSGYIMASSYVDMFLLAANAPGGGDFKANGSVPMTGDLDLAGFKAKNSAAPSDPNDLTRKDYVDDEIAAAIADVVADAVAAAQAAAGDSFALEFETKKDGDVLVPAAITAIPDLSVTVDWKAATKAILKFTGLYDSQGLSAEPVVQFVFRIDGTTQIWSGKVVHSHVGSGDDFLRKFPVCLEIPIDVNDFGGGGVHTIEVLHYHGSANNRCKLLADASTYPVLSVMYVPND